MRPGRFDRRVVLDRPDVRGREAILKVHTRGKPIDPEVDLTREYLLHSLLDGGLVERFGFVKGSRPATPDDPAFNLTGDPFFSDGLRLVIDGGEAGNNVSVEIIARGEHSNVFVATEAGEDAYKCIDAAVHKLERQLRRKKTKERNNKHPNGGHEAE